MKLPASDAPSTNPTDARRQSKIKFSTGFCSKELHSFSDDEPTLSHSIRSSSGPGSQNIKE
jgi:hypothetical protein